MKDEWYRIRSSSNAVNLTDSYLPCQIRYCDVLDEI